MSQFFASGGQSIGASASASAIPKNIQDWFSSGLTGLISLGIMGKPLFFILRERKISVLITLAAFPPSRSFSVGALERPGSESGGRWRPEMETGYSSQVLISLCPLDILQCGELERKCWWRTQYRLEEQNPTKECVNSEGSHHTSTYSESELAFHPGWSPLVQRVHMGLSSSLCSFPFWAAIPV